jgi:hypothetical protein
MTDFRESYVEQATLGWFADLGYSIQHDQTIAPGDAAMTKLFGTK